MEMCLGIIWFISACLVLAQYTPQCKDLKGADLIIVFLILTLGAPAFVVASAFEGVLSYFLPEGDNDDNFRT